MSQLEAARRHHGRARQAKAKHRKKVDRLATRKAERRLLDQQFQKFKNDDQVLDFREWCLLNGFSSATGRRIIERGEVIITRLSSRRIGISVANNRRWQESRTRGRA
jgi:hypothetical protein